MSETREQTQPHATQSPAERRRRKVRDAIVSAAERMFAREGEAGLSIRKLAEEIDYSPGAIYKYFESKQDLVDALKEAFFEQLHSEMEEFEGQADDYLVYMHGFLRTYVRVALGKPHHYAAAFTGLPEDGAPRVHVPEDSLKVQAFMQLRKRVEMGVALGVFRKDLQVTQTAKSIWASLHGFVALMAHIPHFHAIMLDDKPPSSEHFISDHIDFILQGLSK